LNVRAIDIINRNTGASDRVFTLYGYPNWNYFSRRLFAGNQLALYPGYFSSPRQQTDILEALERQSVGMAIVMQKPLDGRPERALQHFAPKICNYLDREFMPLVSIGDLKVLRPRAYRAPTVRGSG